MYVLSATLSKSQGVSPERLSNSAPATACAPAPRQLAIE
jgi:hypothetical protein